MGPWSAAGYRGTAGHAPGAVYWLRSASRAYGRYVTTVERVEEIDRGRRIVYTVTGGMPVRGYRGEVTLTAVPGGTRVSWVASWDKTLLVPSMNRNFPGCGLRISAGPKRNGTHVREELSA